MSQVQSSGLADLEKELVCSICTELLYQPLTLLDCLHTFCGSCVKEWFSAQGSRRSRASPPFTCPSCRAEVRDTRPNATVTTLLDMVLTAHPDRARAADEKAEIATRYTQGESVFPALPSGGESAEEDGEDDRRILEEVRELSLRESRAQARRETRRTDQSSRTRERSTNTERPTEDSRSRRRRDDDTTRQQRTLRPDDSDRTRRVEHQSSLRSLLSLSSDAETMEEEILRQILEDGLLDNINLDNLGPRQEEELSERIADAYRRRHMQRPQSRQRPEADGATRTHARSESAHRTAEPTAATREHNVRRPPVSRPHLFDSAPTRPSTAGHQRRSSEQVSGRRRTSPVRTNQASASDEAIRPAARSASDITADRHVSQTGRLRSESASARPRRATESEQSISRAWVTGGRERSSSRQSTSQSATNSPISGAAPSNSSRNSLHTEHTIPSLSSPLVPIRSDRRTRPSSSRSNVPASPTVQFPEPSISCDRCGKGNIQYNLHKKCPSCKDGNFHLCLQCYRLGRGCLRWNGFGASAHTTFQRIISSSTRRPLQMNDPGHVLMWFKYLRPSETAHRTMSGERQMTSDNPVRRLQSGLFCDTCQSQANDCFWKCNQCNDGDWGFCNSCVNQGRCCTHALLPIRRFTHGPPPSAPSTTPPPAESNTTPTPSEVESFKILSFSTNCDICTYPIPASNTRYHCLECNGGDYDVCTNCYLKLVATGKINKENGHNGWRRCLAGHRTIVVGFEDHEEGQRRVIVRDLVGGRALNEKHVAQSQLQSPTSSPASGGPVASPEQGIGDWSWEDGPERRKKASRLRGGPAPMNSTTGSTTAGSDPSNPPPSSATATPIIPPFRRFPPDGGVGLIVYARWSWYPEEEVEDELVFPRGAHITESENINDDWFWGCYAGRTGLFPGSHVEFVREVHR
ncbi:Zinc finger, RING-type [Penicillium expansum]|uniref:Zinc finger, RING-type n=1 Tax=Penicillium expansum TaxID=27334 RepID=A0A0A2IK74_PENEN|nr:Zinc finger, RING-type [Penicillium expansum]KGO42833.1 Zinc finger, RING-type [Penicillium expansum]KGO56954.1 Zinc finger, RING-type [Penicillium expansum]KGO65751.1 Zinc finger, RING-type [Penicillium expansum]